MDGHDSDQWLDEHGAREGGSGHPAAALGVALAAWTLGVLAIVLYAVARPAWTSDQWYFVVDLADAFVYGLVALLLLRRTNHPVAWIIAVTAVGGGVAAVGFQWLTLWFDHPDLYDGAWLLSSSGWGWVPGTLALMVIVPYLVRSGPIDAPTGVLIAAGAGLTLFMWITRLTDPSPTLPDGRALAPFPLGGERWANTIESVTPWLLRAIPALGVVATLDVVRRWRTGRASAGRGLGWLAWGAGLMSVSFVPLALPDSWASHLPVAFTPLIHLASQAFFPAALVVAVLGQRLWGLELFVSRTLTWGLLTGAVVTVYVALLAALSPLMSSDRGPQVIATAFVVAGAQPGLGWIRQRVDHLVRGSASEPLRVVRQVSRHLGRTPDTEASLSGVLESVAASLRLGWVAIEAPVHDRGDEAPSAVMTIASWGSPGGDPARVPLLRDGVPIGELVASGRSNERLDRRTIASLESLAPILSGVLSLVTISQELAESRARIAAARDDERRTLRRELHDGLGPALAGIGLALKASRNLLESDPEAAANLLDQLSSGVDAQVESVRTLAHGLVPPALEDLGLAPALAEIAERYHVTGLTVHVDVGPLPPLDPVVTGALYAIVAEAVRNVHRHAHATGCTVHLVYHDGLELTVSDDGIGLDPAATAGVGLRSMRERAEGIGGQLAVTAATAGGTVVRVTLPRAAVHPASPTLREVST